MWKRFLENVDEKFQTVSTGTYFLTKKAWIYNIIYDPFLDKKPSISEQEFPPWHLFLLSSYFTTLTVTLLLETLGDRPPVPVSLRTWWLCLSVCVDMCMHPCLTFVFFCVYDYIWKFEPHRSWPPRENHDHNTIIVETTTRPTSNTQDNNRKW